MPFRNVQKPRCLIIFEEMLERKFWLKNKLEEEYRLANASDTTTTNTTLDEELCSVPS